jgi:hypothetical protein
MIARYAPKEPAFLRYAKKVKPKISLAAFFLLYRRQNVNFSKSRCGVPPFVEVPWFHYYLREKIIKYKRLILGVIYLVITLDPLLKQVLENTKHPSRLEKNILSDKAIHIYLFIYLGLSIWKHWALLMFALQTPFVLFPISIIALAVGVIGLYKGLLGIRDKTYYYSTRPSNMLSPITAVGGIAIFFSIISLIVSMGILFIEEIIKLQIF